MLNNVFNVLCDTFAPPPPKKKKKKKKKKKNRLLGLESTI